jgi:pyruvate,water dikinase
MTLREDDRPITLPFTSALTTLDRAGGKGMNLSVLARAGFHVPAGFIITTDAYRDFVAANALQPQILALAAQADGASAESLETASAALRSLFENAVMPVQIARAIADAHHALVGKGDVNGTVAVRSSATAEDLPGLSFAGQQDTYLNIIGVDAVVDAVKKCWGSLWTARAIGYRLRNNIAPADVALAVVVQVMVISESSGVLFTANPLTGNREQMVIDASFGLGEAIVSGQVEPDHIVMTHLGEVIERRIGAKAMAIVPNVAGGTQHVALQASSQSVLSDAQIKNLAQTVTHIAQHFGQPQDIEWAWANAQLYVLQSRPITSLYPLPLVKDKQADDRLRTYFSFNSVQGVMDAFTPMGQDALQMLFGGIVALAKVERPADEIIKPAGGRLYIDATDIAHDPRLRKVFVSALSAVDPGARLILKRLIDEGRFPSRSALTPRVAWRTIRALRPTIARAIHSMIKPAQAAQEAPAEAERFIADVITHIDHAGDFSTLLQSMQTDFERALFVLARALMSAVAPALLSLRLIDKWLVEWLGEQPGASLALTRSLNNNVTTQMDMHLWATAQRISADPPSRDALSTQPLNALAAAYRRGELPAIAQQALSTFLDTYGMRGLAEIDLGRPRWRDDPSPVLQTLRNYLQWPADKTTPDQLFAQGEQEAERLASVYLARARQLPFGAVRATLLGAFIRRLRLFAGLRELPKFCMVRILGAYRVALLAHATAMVEKGDLRDADDIFFASLNDLKLYARGEPIDLKSRAKEGRAAFDFEQQRKRMPRILLGNGEAFYEGIQPDDNDDGAGVMRGQAVSPGVVEGIVRVVLDPRHAQLQPGDILVCPATDPSWTPLFLTAGGLVMEIGGMVTHGSVVAREYGLPAVVGVHEATTRLRSGQRVRVDGGSGRVTILDASSGKGLQGAGAHIES